MKLESKSIEKIKKITDVGDLIIGGKITTIDSLLLKIRRYQHLKYYRPFYCKECGDIDVGIRIGQSSDKNIFVCFFLLYREGQEIEKFSITNLASSEEFLMSLYQGLVKQADCRELTLIKMPDSSIRSFSFQISEFVWFDFDQNFCQDNPMYNDFFENIYNNATDDYIYRIGVDIDEGKDDNKQKQKIYSGNGQ